MTVVTGDIDLPGNPQPAYLGRVELALELVGDDGPIDTWITGDDQIVTGRLRVPVAANGAWSVDLVGNAALTPPGTRYRRTLSVAGQDSAPQYWDVPSSGGPFTELQVLDDPPSAVESSALAAHKGQAIGAHAATAISVPSVGLLSATDVAAQLAQTEGYLRTVSRRVVQEHDLVTFGPNITENTLFTFTIPGGQAVGGHEYRFRTWGEIQNNSGGDTNLTFRVRRNTSIVEMHFGAVVVPTGADFRYWEFEFTQFMDNDFSLNLTAKLRVGALVVAGVLQGDDIASRCRFRQANLTSGDWASNVTFEPTAQFSVNGPTIRRHGADMTWTFTTPG